MKKKRDNPEQRLQVAAIRWLRGALPFTFAFHVPNGGSRHPAEAAKLKAMGVTAGVPDIIIFWAGGCGVIELKASTGSMTKHQLNTIELLNSLGVRTAVCRGLNEVETAVREWGLKPYYSVNKLEDLALGYGGRK